MKYICIDSIIDHIIYLKRGGIDANTCDIILEDLYQMAEVCKEPTVIDGPPDSSKNNDSRNR